MQPPLGDESNTQGPRGSREIAPPAGFTLGIPNLVGLSAWPTGPPVPPGRRLGSGPAPRLGSPGACSRIAAALRPRRSNVRDGRNFRELFALCRPRSGFPGFIRASPGLCRPRSGIPGFIRASLGLCRPRSGIPGFTRASPGLCRPRLPSPCRPTDPGWPPRGHADSPTKFAMPYDLQEHVPGSCSHQLVLRYDLKEHVPGSCSHHG